MQNYGIKGHTIERCYKLIGYPNDFKFMNDSQGSNKTIPENNIVVTDVYEKSFFDNNSNSSSD